jgi:cytochrome c biogenesis protein CcmG, thiol:disulfide interchange protein DsbE
MTRAWPLALCLLALAGCGSQQEAAGPAPKPKLAGAPSAVKRIYLHRDQLVGGGLTAYRTELKSLRGTPVVVNKWASWCAPCRAEFPLFRKQAAKRGGRIAFLGVNSNDNEGDARKFLKQLPLPYPSYIDGDNKIAADFNGVQGFPATVFYSPNGKVNYLHLGQYPSEQKLAQDIDRYAR